MTSRLLPRGFDASLRLAVRTFWATRGSGSDAQGGARGNVIAGQNLDGFLAVVRAVAEHCGIPESSVFAAGRRDATLPGYYRPTKNWDVVIVHRSRLLAVLEFKSQVGSFGNNFNNRAEEVIGSASDLWVAAQQGAYHPANHVDEPMPHREDPRPPFLGYLMLLEDSYDSTRPVNISSRHFRAFPEFSDASYAERYRILCERLMQQGLYKAAALMLSPQGERGLAGKHKSLSEATSAKNLFAQLAGQLLADVEM